MYNAHPNGSAHDEGTHGCSNHIGAHDSGAHSYTDDFGAHNIRAHRDADDTRTVYALAHCSSNHRHAKRCSYHRHAHECSHSPALTRPDSCSDNGAANGSAQHSGASYDSNNGDNAHDSAGTVQRCS